MMAGQRDHLPSYSHGFARGAAESQFPELWKGLVGAWAPLLGVTGATLPDWSGRGRAAVSLIARTLAWRGTNSGVAILGDTSSSSDSLVVPTWTTMTTFSIAAFVRLDTVSGAVHPIATDSSRPCRGFVVANDDLRWIDAGGTSTSSPAHLIAAGAWTLLGMSAHQGTGTFWINASACGSATVQSVDVSRVILNAISVIRGVTGFVGFWNRPLALPEWQRLTTEPLSLFLPSRHACGVPSSLPAVRVPYRRIISSICGAGL